jgi:hypothetical protein
MASFARSLPLHRVHIDRRLTSHANCLVGLALPMVMVMSIGMEQLLSPSDA